MTDFEEIIVELSYNCNLSCTMCGFGKEVNPYSKSKFLTFENYKNILHQIGDKTKTIRLNGRGESSIHPNFVEILNYTKEKYPSVNINLFSNFSFNNRRILDALIKNQVQLFISMDSSEADELTAIRKGARFQYIEENIKRLRDLPNRPFIYNKTSWSPDSKYIVWSGKYPDYGLIVVAVDGSNKMKKILKGMNINVKEVVWSPK